MLLISCTLMLAHIAPGKQQRQHNAPLPADQPATWLGPMAVIDANSNKHRKDVLEEAVCEEKVAKGAVRECAAALRHQPQLVVRQAHSVRIHRLAHRGS